MHSNQDRAIAGKSKPRMEFIFIIISGIFVYFLSAHYDVLERVVDFTRRHENWQSDELLIVSAYLMIGFAVYSFRRWRDVQSSHDHLMRKNEELHQAFNEIKRLRGIIPICSSCKKIRDDSGYWHQVESYIRDHSEAEFTHSLCPDCVKKLYPWLL